MAKHDIKTNAEDSIMVVIPAAGVGRRMKSYGPKPLLQINRETVLKRQIRIVKTVIANPKFTIVCGFECDKVMDSCPDYVIRLENENYDKTNIARSLSIALRSINSRRVLIINGDLAFDKLAISNLDFNSSCISASEDLDKESEVGCIVDGEGNLTNMMYDLPLKWNQITYLQDAALEEFKKQCFNRKHSKLFSFEIMNKVISKGHKIKCIVNEQCKVIDIDTSKDLIKANKYYDTNR